MPRSRVSDQPKRVRRLGRGQPARARPAPHQHRRRRAEPAASSVRTCPRPSCAPALGEADDQQAGVLGQGHHALAARRGQERLGHDARRSAGRSASASASRRLASRPSSRPSEAAPISRSGAPVARATQAPSSSAAQSCQAAPNGTITGPEPQRAAGLEQHCHVAWRLLEDDRGLAVERRRGRRPSAAVPRSRWDARRTMSSPGAGDENAAVRAASPSAEELVPAVGERRRRVGRASAGRDDAGDDQLARRIRGRRAAAASARRAVEAVERSWARRSSERSARASRPAGLRIASAAGRGRGRAGRIACSSRLSSSPGSRPELLGELASGHPVGVQRLGLAARAVEREHQLASQPLPAAGARATSASSSPTSSAWRPPARSASIRCSSAARRSSSRRATSAWANGS